MNYREIWQLDELHLCPENFSGPKICFNFKLVLLRQSYLLFPLPTAFFAIEFDRVKLCKFLMLKDETQSLKCKHFFSSSCVAAHSLDDR